MNNSNTKKADQLGMPHGTASNRLRKMLLFSLLKELGRNVCYQCEHTIETVEELSIEHKKPWLDSDSPIDLFFNLENIGYSHLSCNSGAARYTEKNSHPSLNSYNKGCRCHECVTISFTSKLKGSITGSLNRFKKSNGY